MEYIKKSKYKLAVIAFVVILISLSSKATLAYYVLQGTSKNIITTGDVDISIVETLNGVAFTGNINVAPGSTLNRALYVQNVGGHPCWLRIKIETTKNVDDRDVISMHIDSQNWIYQDGYYYYKNILASGATTAALYDQLSILEYGDETEERYSGTYVSMAITAEAIQSENNEAVSSLQTKDEVPKVWPEGVKIIPKEVAP